MNIRKVYLCGPGGSGKTTLARDLCKRLKGFKLVKEVARVLLQERGVSGTALINARHDEFQRFQKDFLLAECDEEIKIENECEDYISDCSIFDCLSYSIWKCPEHEGNIKLEIGAFCQKYKVEEDICAAVERYRSSLFVIVYPWSTTIAVEDGVRYRIAFSESQIFIDILKELLNFFNINFLELKENDRDERLDIIIEAMESGFAKR